MSTQNGYEYVADLKAEFGKRRDQIRSRLQEFAKVPESEYPYELIYCLLTPQSSAASAAKALARLREECEWDSEAGVAKLLHGADYYIRFHNTKAKHVVKAWQSFPVILDELRKGHTGLLLRSWLVRNVSGMGWKEASHFLRNIGHRNLAILDRHILKNLVCHGVISEVPKTLSAKLYREIETRFAGFADEVGITMDEIDLLFWSRETGVVLK